MSIKCHSCLAPIDLATRFTIRKLDLKGCHVMEQRVRATHNIEQFEEAFDGEFCGFIRIEFRHAGSPLYKAHREIMKEFASLGLIQSASFESDAHRVQLHLADNALETED